MKVLNGSIQTHIEMFDQEGILLQSLGGRFIS
jgi:hypothetical protein